MIKFQKRIKEELSYQSSSKRTQFLPKNKGTCTAYKVGTSVNNHDNLLQESDILCKTSAVIKKLCILVICLCKIYKEITSSLKCKTTSGNIKNNNKNGVQN
jgi:hypothetical protein